MLAAEELPTIPLHVVVISDRPEVADAITPDVAGWLADALNQEFHDGHNKALAQFKVIAVTGAGEVTKVAPEFLKISSSSEFHAVRKAVLQSSVFRRDALNIFIYSNPTKSRRSQGGMLVRAKKLSGKYQKDYWSWILFEAKALRARDAKLLLHESGHAFGLPHVKPVTGDENSPDRNIMTGNDESPKSLPEGESGYYFTPSQALVIQKSTAGMVETFRRAAEGAPLLGAD